MSLTTMEPSTKEIAQSRHEVVAIGNFGQYRKSCSQRLLQLRRKLKIATAKGRHYEPRKLQDISPGEYADNTSWREYLIFSAERAWAHAMEIKSLHVGDSGEGTLSGQARSHVLSRLTKAARAAGHLVSLSKQKTGTEQERHLLLAHGAYWKLLEGVTAFEGQKWEKSLVALSEAHVLYTALEHKEGGGSFYREWLSDNIEPSVRYAAYQLRLSRTLAVEKVVARFVPRGSELVKTALTESSDAIFEEKPATEARRESIKAIQDVPSSITWRGRTVKLEDARIAQALGAVKAAESALEAEFSSKRGSASEQAAAYEGILGSSQDAVDATKTALDELTAEGVVSSDPRMQSLQITRTAVNYDLIGWRIGRNRVLCGKSDGAEFDEEQPKAPKGHKNNFTKEGRGKKLARLRSRVVLYDTTLDSLDSIRDLPGIAADQDLLKRLASRKAYFAALRSLAIARSHALLGNSRNSLALLTQAATSAASVTANDDGEPGLKSGLPQHYLSSEQASTVKKLIEGLKLQVHALVELDNLDAEAVKAEKAKAAWSTPLIERLDEYPVGGADLNNLVSYPPKLRPVPVNPIFLDVAWNYIQYPGQKQEAEGGNLEPGTAAVDASEKPAKKGWFGWGGRS